MMATVHLIDDDEAMRTALGRLLSAAGYRVRTYAAAGDYLVPAPDDDPSCLLLDLQLPGISGLELQAALPHHPDYERPIIFLSGTADVRASVQAMRAGASEFLTKPIQRDALLAAVKVAVGRDVALRERRRRARQARSRLESLAPRERKVLDGIVAGKLHKQIAAELGVSERTIKVDRARVMKQMGARTLADLLRMLAESAQSIAEGAAAALQDRAPAARARPRPARPPEYRAGPASEASPSNAPEASMRTAVVPVLLALAALSAALSAAARPATAPAAPSAGDPSLEPAALQALQRMGECLQGLQAFGLKAKASTEQVLEEGQKIQLDAAMSMWVRRPDRLRVDLASDRKSRQFHFDGRTFTVFTHRAGRYAKVDAPSSIAALLAKISEKYGVAIPLTDLFTFTTDPARQARLARAMAIGLATVQGTTCDHYAFRQKGLDWQVWIERGDRPLPRRLVLTATDDAARPQHAIDLDWSLDEPPADAVFAFVPPAGSHEIPLGRVGASAARSRPRS
jgi:FixJ family two-component response regulator